MTPALTILDKAVSCFRTVHQNLLEGAQHLHHIEEREYWNQRHDSFGAFVEEECGISASMASKLLRTYRHYVIAGGIAPASLRGIDNEKLYLAITTKGTPHEQVARAATLSRQELKAERAEKDGVQCTHETTVHICSSCHLRIA